MKFRIIEFEGTAEEFKEVQHLFDQGQAGTVSIIDTSLDPKEAITKVLRRLPVTEAQRDLYEALAGGQRVDYQQLLKRMGKESGELRGALGALGRRISATPEIKQAGLEPNVYAILNYEYEGDDVYISLKPYALEALREEGVI